MLLEPKQLLRAMFLFLLLSGTAASAVTIQTLGVTGDPVPGLPGETFEAFRRPQVSSDGWVAFSAWDTSTSCQVGGCDRDGAWLADHDGNLTSVARSGTPAPGTSGGFFLGTNDPVPLPTGRVVFFDRLSGAGVGAANDSGYWRGTRSPG